MHVFALSPRLPHQPQHVKPDFAVLGVMKVLVLHDEPAESGLWAAETCQTVPVVEDTLEPHQVPGVQAV